MKRLLHAALILALCGGCGVPVPRPYFDPDAAFPHPDDWVWEHGPSARADEEGCLLCHPTEPQEGVDYRTEDVPPPCSACHGYPVPVSDDEEGGAA